MVDTCRIIVICGSQFHFGDAMGGPVDGATCPPGPLMISSIPLLFGTKTWWTRQRGARSSRGRIPIGQKKSVLWSVGSRNLRGGGGFVVEGVEEAEEGIEEEDDTEVDGSEEDGSEEDGTEEDTGEEATEQDVEKVEHLVDGHT